MTSNDDDASAPQPTTRCPKCGTAGVPLVFGFPQPETMEAANRGELVLGGCCVTPEVFELACPSCGCQFGPRKRLPSPHSSLYDQLQSELERLRAADDT